MPSDRTSSGHGTRDEAQRYLGMRLGGRTKPKPGWTFRRAGGEHAARAVGQGSEKLASDREACSKKAFAKYCCKPPAASTPVRRQRSPGPGGGAHRQRDSVTVQPFLSSIFFQVHHVASYHLAAAALQHLRLHQASQYRSRVCSLTPISETCDN